MKRMFLGAAVLAMLGGQTLAGATHPATTFTGTIAVGNPARTGNPADGSAIHAGITENLAPCDPASPANGIDGFWFDVTGYGDHAATLGAVLRMDLDAYFYTADCTFIDYTAMAAGFLNTAENGTVPTDAAFAHIQGWVGAQIPVTFTVG